MRRSLLVVGFLSVLACAAADTSAFKLSSLVLPQGVSYELGPVTLTRTLDAATSASKVGNSSSKTQEESSGEKKTVGSGVESSRTSGHSSGSNLGGSIGGSSGGSGGFSLMGLLGIHTDIGGKISSEDSRNQKSSDHNGTERVSESTRGSKSGSSSEFEELEQYGQYHLKFSVTFKSKDLSDTFLVGGPNARVILNGFSAPVPVPYTERTDPVRLRAEERTFFFDYPIADQVTLRDAKRMVAQGRRNAVTLSLVGDEFPVVSERTKDNVVSEITRLMKLSPNTLVAVDFGDVKRLSPWRVRRKFTKASGRKGARVTVREALRALNEVLAEDEEMPDEAFAFASDGRLASVLDTPAIAAPRKDDVALVFVSATEDGSDGASEVHFPTKEFLDRPLGDFAELRLVTGSLAELAQAAVYVPEKAAALRAEVESALGSVPAATKLWKELLTSFESEKASSSKKKTAEEDAIRKSEEEKEARRRAEEDARRKVEAERRARRMAEEAAKRTRIVGTWLVKVFTTKDPDYPINGGWNPYHRRYRVTFRADGTFSQTEAERWRDRAYLIPGLNIFASRQWLPEETQNEAPLCDACCGSWKLENTSIVIHYDGWAGLIGMPNSFFINDSGSFEIIANNYNGSREQKYVFSRITY